ncbi:hypothetical protein HPP05_31175 [Corallococcus exiguus]|uniref:hypothetical protein n=1 Tax=Corallococcus exiguus TaxID=83462 RepID=UPI0014943845|nr:hypothetical protein [Corallococcus exiguus]NPC74225.1 hypothetical protein [Corallococcus exiguus]
MHSMTLQVVLSETPEGTTRLRVTGELEPIPSAPSAHRLFALLARWTGTPIDLVLHVDANSQAWSDAWLDALAGVDADHIEVRFAAAVSGKVALA